MISGWTLRAIIKYYSPNLLTNECSNCIYKNIHILSTNFCSLLEDQLNAKLTKKDQTFRHGEPINPFVSCALRLYGGQIQSHTEYRHALQSQRDTLRDCYRNEGADVDGTVCFSGVKNCITRTLWPNAAATTQRHADR